MHIRAARTSWARSTYRRIQMMDVILLGLGVALFAVSVGYAYACERL
jgi:hypothetical protein